MQIVPSDFCHIGAERSVLWPSNTPKSVFGWGFAPDLAGELTTLPRPPSRLERGHPSHTPPHSVPTHLRLSPCVPQNSSQIYAYDHNTTTFLGEGDKCPLLAHAMRIVVNTILCWSAILMPSKNVIWLACLLT